MTPHQVGWLIILVATLCMEAATAGLVTIWFSAGALAALITALFGAGIYVQITVFLIVSALLLIFTRPVIHGKLVVKKQRTNADKLVGERAVVCEEINSFDGSGQVKVSGQMWSAKSEKGELIPRNTVVVIKEIRGVSVIVEKESAE